MLHQPNSGIYFFLCQFYISNWSPLVSCRSTNPPHQRQTHHQQPAPATNRPPHRAWCLPPRRPRATPPCPQPQQCTTAPATVAYPPISASGMCRTRLDSKASHTSFQLHGTIWQETFFFGTRVHVRGRAREKEGHTDICLFFIWSLIGHGEMTITNRGGKHVS